MSARAARGLDLRFDEDGFLTDPDLWTHPLAETLARDHGFDGLSPDQWRVVHWLRRHYYEVGAPPSAHQVCHEIRLPHNCIDSLFHRDLRAAWRIAGLPNPGEEAKAYMHGTD